jgi:PPOX class probable F420-dependent enzyme
LQAGATIRLACHERKTRPPRSVSWRPVPFAIDTSTDAGARVERRLREELMVWLTTVSPRGAPVPSPVWFLWDGGSFLVYSRPETAKLRNIERNPRVSLNLDGNGRGGDIVIVSGEARASDDPPADRVPAYVEKYAERIAANGWSPASFAADYSVAIRIAPRRLRGG